MSAVQRFVRQKGEPQLSLTSHVQEKPSVESGTARTNCESQRAPQKTTRHKTGQAIPTADTDFQPQRSHLSIGNLPDQETTGHQNATLGFLLQRKGDEEQAPPPPEGYLLPAVREGIIMK